MNGVVLAMSFAVVLTACSTAPEAPPAPRPEAPATGRQLHFELASGVYRCEPDLAVDVQRRADLIHVRWEGREYDLPRQDSYSGLPRFEDRANGLLWIDLPWKSVLLDSATGQPLANECRPI